MFNKIISRMGEPVTKMELIKDKDSVDTLDIVSKFLRTMYALCKRINSDDLDDSKTQINYISRRSLLFKYTPPSRRLPLPPHVVQQVPAHNGTAGIALYLPRAHEPIHIHETGV